MKSKDKSLFSPQVYLESVGVSRKVGEFRKKQTIFAQGDPANTVIYIQKGSVKFTVVNESGKVNSGTIRDTSPMLRGF